MSPISTFRIKMSNDGLSLKVDSFPPIRYFRIILLTKKYHVATISISPVSVAGDALNLQWEEREKIPIELLNLLVFR